MWDDMLLHSPPGTACPILPGSRSRQYAPRSVMLEKPGNVLPTLLGELGDAVDRGFWVLLEQKSDVEVEEGRKVKGLISC